MSAEMTCRQAGRLGGIAVRERHGRAYFRRIGALSKGWPPGAASKGGQALRAKLAADEDAREQHLDYSRKGGETLLARYGIDHYREIGRKGAAAKKAKREAAG